MLLISYILIENKMFKYKKNKYSETRDEWPIYKPKNTKDCQESTEDRKKHGGILF